MENRRFTRLTNGFSKKGKSITRPWLYTSLITISADAQKPKMYASHGRRNYKACVDIERLTNGSNAVLRFSAKTLSFCPNGEILGECQEVSLFFVGHITKNGFRPIVRVAVCDEGLLSCSIKQNLVAELFFDLAVFFDDEG